MLKSVAELQAMKDDMQKAIKAYSEKGATRETLLAWDSAQTKYTIATPFLIDLVLRMAEWDSDFINACIEEINDANSR